MVLADKHGEYDDNSSGDDMRISSFTSEDAQTHHKIPASSKAAKEKIASHYGKSFVILPNDNSFSNQSVGKASSKKATKSHYLSTLPPAVNEPLANQAGPSNNNSVPNIGEDPESQAAQILVAEHRGEKNAGCWKTLQDFKNISINSHDIVIKDQFGQPCYLLHIGAFIKWNDDAYFALDNFKTFPHINKLSLTNGTSDADRASLPLNCSIKSASGLAEYVGLLSINLKMRPIFREEILIFVNCGYLKLVILSDLEVMSLESISFYQYSQINPFELGLNKMISFTHLIFTTNSSNTAPLLLMPVDSRYVCNYRVVLTGNNKIQLVLHKFELQRLSLPMLFPKDSVAGQQVQGSMSSARANHNRAGNESSPPNVSEPPDYQESVAIRWNPSAGKCWRRFLLRQLPGLLNFKISQDS